MGRKEFRSFNNISKKKIIFIHLAVGYSVLACRAYTYQGLFDVLVSFVLPFGKIVGFLLTFPFILAVVATHWGNAYS
jgi:hypothetical protein